MDEETRGTRFFTKHSSQKPRILYLQYLILHLKTVFNTEQSFNQILISLEFRRLKKLTLKTHNLHLEITWKNVEKE